MYGANHIFHFDYRTICTVYFRSIHISILRYKKYYCATHNDSTKVETSELRSLTLLSQALQVNKY